MRVTPSGVLASAVAGLMILTSGAAATAGIAQPRIVSANPANFTPQVPRGEYETYALQQVGTTMYVGGKFSTLGGQSRSNIGAFSATTGAMAGFAPRFNGPVWAIESLGGSRLAVGGDFTTVNGLARRGLAVLNATTGATETTFNANLNGRVTSLQLVNGRLIAGGGFAKKLQAVNPASGADTGYLNLNISGAYVYRAAVSPDRTRLVAVANINSVSGQARRQAFMVDLGASRGTLASWYYQPLSKQCAGSSYNFYLRDVDFSPTGTYFVLAGTGFVPQANDTGITICDAAARFETANPTPFRPTWINYTGGDTLHSVTVSTTAVYVGGHQRWLDNPLGRDTCGPGCVSRSGIGAINPTSGKALSWNPRRTRGIGAKELLLTQAGLWV
ncbi:MAG: hypothetical protein JWR85_384, partial [Marmoricola sp.]|nr:hypothetical protein [Marmoricola sp.]